MLESEMRPTRQVISRVCALALVVGGLYWLGIIVIDWGGWLTDGYQGPTKHINNNQLESHFSASR
jgi:hypothetical protein